MTTSRGPTKNNPSRPLSNPAQGSAQTRSELIDVEAVATWLGVEIVFVRRLIAERRIPFLKIGKFIRFDPSEVARWIDDQRVGFYKERSARRGRL
jgi:excisionase family DNA binding protein